MGYLKSYQFQHAFSAALTILLSFILSAYLADPIAYWMVLTAFLVNPVTCGTTLRQSMLALFFIIIALACSLALVLLTKHWIYNMFVLIIVYLISAYIAYYRESFSDNNFYLNFIFFIVLLLALLPGTFIFESGSLSFSSILGNSVMSIGDALLGGIIGICGSQFILPARIEKEFRHGIIPVLYAIRHYDEGVINTFIKHERNPLLLAGKRIQLETSLQSRRGIYPNWVYEIGFNRGLRKGYRFFLINIEKLCESVFALAGMAGRQTDAAIINSMVPYIQKTMQKNNELLEILINFFESEKIVPAEGEYMRDVIELENALRRIMPGNLELLDMMPDYITLVAFVRTLKDMRERLLQLMNAIA